MEDDCPFGSRLGFQGRLLLVLGSVPPFFLLRNIEGCTWIPPFVLVFRGAKDWVLVASEFFSELGTLNQRTKSNCFRRTILVKQKAFEGLVFIDLELELSSFGPQTNGLQPPR